MKNDKRLMFNRIKLALSFNTDAKLAKFLGITPQTLSNCVIRNTVDWDNMLSKCESINLDWLITGRGEMFLNSPNLTGSETKEDKRTIKNLNNRIEDLEKEIKMLKGEIGMNLDDAKIVKVS